MSEYNKVVMKLPIRSEQLIDSYYNEPEEWLSSTVVNDYIDRRTKLELSFYPDLHISKENKVSGLSLYKMNGMIQGGGVDDYNKVFEFFYRGCEGMFEGIDEHLPFCDINLFYDEKNLPTFVITVKLCPGIHPFEPGLYHDKLVKAVTTNSSTIKSFFRFFLKKKNVNFHCVLEIPRQYSKWASEREIRKYYGGFICNFYAE